MSIVLFCEGRCTREKCDIDVEIYAKNKGIKQPETIETMLGTMIRGGNKFYVVGDKKDTSKAVFFKTNSKNEITDIDEKDQDKIESFCLLLSLL